MTFQQQAAPEPLAGADLHPDDLAVDVFAAAMKGKLARSRAKGRSGWQQASAERLSAMLREHVEKGDPLDVANFAMMLYMLGRPIVTGIAANGPMEPTKYLDRFRAALALLCGGHVPTVRDCEMWLRNEQDGHVDPLQEWAINHAAVNWAQGIAVIDAATVLADQPEEGVDHETREDAYPSAQPTFDDLHAMPALLALPVRDMRVDACTCEACMPNGNPFAGGSIRMIVCATCGNKRCPHATDHAHACTGSNEPGQPGSSYAQCRPFNLATIAQIAAVTLPRFENVSCSQCGCEFGAGNTGFSHCEDHAHLRGRQ